jgi:hypothetical protein
MVEKRDLRNEGFTAFFVYLATTWDFLRQIKNRRFLVAEGNCQKMSRK